jgi:hypothetical protein
MNWKRAGLTLVMLLALATCWVQCSSSDEDEYERLIGTIRNEAHPDVTFQIHQTVEFFEPITALSYTVISKENIVSRSCTFSGTYEQEEMSKFQLLAADSLLYLTWKNEPNQVLAIYNVRTKQSFPNCNDESETLEESIALREKMMKELKLRRPDLREKLLWL